MRALLFLILIPFLSLAQKQKLSIKIEGLERIEGKIMLRVKNTQGEIILKYSQKVDEIPEHIQLELAPGTYAIACFHDANNNNKIDRNFAGLPTEVYAFSNNVRGTFGPPDLVDQLFELKTAKTISLRLE